MKEAKDQIGEQYEGSKIHREEQPFGQGDCVDGTCIWLDYSPGVDLWFCHKYCSSAPNERCSWAKQKKDFRESPKVSKLKTTR